MRIETVTSRLRTDSRRRLFRGRGQQRRRGRDNPKVVASSPASHDIDAQRRLWAVSEELTSVMSPVG